MPKPSHGPSIRPSKSGIYYIHWCEGGRTKRLSTGTGNLPEAQRTLAGFLLEQGKAADGRMTVGGILTYYDANRVATKVTAKALARRHIKKIKEILGEDRYVDDLASDDFTAYCTQRKKDRNRKGQPINGATIRRELTTFLAACNFAVRNRKIENRHIPVIDLPDGNESKDRWLSRDEARRLMTAAQGNSLTLTPVYRLVAIALATGKRRAAIESLKWFQVDLKNRTIDFRRPGEPETKKRRGRAPISKWLLPILERAYAEKVNEYVLGSPVSAPKRVRFKGRGKKNQPRQRQLSDPPGDLWGPLNAVCRCCGFTDVSCHTLRHTWGTWAAQGGASMWAIAGVLGCSVETATRNYLHHSPEYLRAVADGVSPETVDLVSPDVPEVGREDGRKGVL